jgi:hypothetical protein
MCERNERKIHIYDYLTFFNSLNQKVYEMNKQS